MVNYTALNPLINRLGYSFSSQIYLENQIYFLEVVKNLLLNNKTDYPFKNTEFSKIRKIIKNIKKQIYGHFTDVGSRKSKTSVKVPLYML